MPEPKRDRPVRRAVVTDKRRLSPDLVRLHLKSEDLIGCDVPFSDHYIKLIFGEGEDRATRTYTLRAADPATGEIAVDFVLHGDHGLAGPWADRARPGDEITFHGPGGAWAPSGHGHYVLAGDEAAAPAVCRAIEMLPGGTTATAYLEVADDSARFEVPQRDGVEIRWVSRNGAPYGQRLAAAVREASVPEGAGWFVHGVAEMVKDLRRFLFVEQRVPRSDVSISGYWRAGMTEDGWQSTKRDFVAAMEAEESA